MPQKPKEALRLRNPPPPPANTRNEVAAHLASGAEFVPDSEDEVAKP